MERPASFLERYNIVKMSIMYKFIHLISIDTIFVLEETYADSTGPLRQCIMNMAKTIIENQNKKFVEKIKTLGK